MELNLSGRRVPVLAAYNHWRCWNIPQGDALLMYAISRFKIVYRGLLLGLRHAQQPLSEYS